MELPKTAMQNLTNMGVKKDDTAQRLKAVFKWDGDDIVSLDVDSWEHAACWGYGTRPGRAHNYLVDIRPYFMQKKDKTSPVAAMFVPKTPLTITVTYGTEDPVVPQDRPAILLGRYIFLINTSAQLWAAGNGTSASNPLISRPTIDMPAGSDDAFVHLRYDSALTSRLGMMILIDGTDNRMNRGGTVTTSV